MIFMNSRTGGGAARLDAAARRAAPAGTPADSDGAAVGAADQSGAVGADWARQSRIAGPCGAAGAGAPGADAAGQPGACDDCLRRTALIASLSGWLDVEWRRRDATARVLALPDDHLLALGTIETRRLYDHFEPRAARAAVARAGLSVVCRCSDAYPARLRDLHDPPAVLHVAGSIVDADGVGIVGARRATPYGLEVARALGRGLSASGVTVVSGLALGVDSASHSGALEATGPVVAVLAGGADIPYPSSKRALYARVVERGCVVSEMPPGFRPQRWCFVARNRIIAALSQVLVVVEAAERSGSLTTADFAAELGRTVGAVPGHITCRLATGTNGLLQSGAAPVCGVRDVLELLSDATGGRAPAPRAAAAPASTPPAGPADALDPEVADGLDPELADGLDPDLAELLAAVEAGRGSLGELAGTSEEARVVLARLSELEFRGHIRRTFGGRYERVSEGGLP
jgi:DNA processing protein